MLPKAVRLVSFAWGEQHVKDMLNYALAAAMAPGNLPAIARHFDCTVAVVTETSLFDLVRESETGRRIQEVCTLKLIALDDLLAESWQYGMTLTRALFRGMEDLGPAMTETYFLFLNADFILSDGCYERLIPRIQAGERLHLSPSYCTVEEVVAPMLLDRLKDGELCVPPRELAALILEHRHNTIKAKTVNQEAIEFEHSDQFYWAVDEDTLLGHQMPIAVVGMQPTVALRDLSTFWDWGLIYDFCPDKQLSILGDSDEFLMLEMRPRMRSAESVLLGRSSPRAVAKRMTGYITQYQVDSARFPLTLHAKEIPAGAASARLHLKSYVQTVLANLPSKPIEHSNHSQWRYHAKYFRQRLAKRYLGFYRPRKGAAPIFKPVSFEESLLSRKAAFIRRLLKIRHPYREFIQDAKEAVDSPFPPHVLAVCERGSALLDVLDEIPGLQTHLTPDLVLDGALAFWPNEVSKFDLCLVEAPSGAVASRADELVGMVLRHVASNGKMSLLWYAGSGASQRPLITAAVKLMSEGRASIALRLRASALARLGEQGLRFAHNSNRWGRIGRFLRRPAFATGTALIILSRLLWGNGSGRYLAKTTQPMDSNCVGLVVTLRPLPARLSKPELPYISTREMALMREPAEAKLFYNADPKLTKWVVKSGALKSKFSLVVLGAEEESIARFRVLQDGLVIHHVSEKLNGAAAAPNARHEHYHSMDDVVESGDGSGLDRQKNYVRRLVGVLRALVRADSIPQPDFLMLAARESGPLGELVDAAGPGLLGLEASVKVSVYDADEGLSRNLPGLGGASDTLGSRGLLLYDLNFTRFIRPEYAASRAQLSGQGVDLGAGTPSSFNLLFCRERLRERKAGARARGEASEFVDQVLKFIIICELYGIKDAAVETLLTHAEELDAHIDVEKCLALLCA